MSETRWHRLGPVAQFQQAPVTEVTADGTRLAITWQGAGARELVRRQVEFARLLLGHAAPLEKTERGGRKVHRLDIEL